MSDQAGATEADQPWLSAQAPLHIVLVHPEIPPNTGNIGRLCVGTGCHLHLIEPLGFQIDAKAVRRAGLDYWKRVPLSVYPGVEAFFEANDRPGARFLSLSARRGAPYTAHRFQRGDYLLLGGESKGLPPALVEHPPGPTLRIPHGDGIRSLNLANAAAVVVFEALRQLYPATFPSPGEG